MKNIIYCRDIVKKNEDKKTKDWQGSIAVTEEVNGYGVFYRDKENQNYQLLQFFREFKREDAIEFCVDYYRSELVKNRIEA